MSLKVSVRHLGYRLAYRLLALAWALSGFRPDGVKCVICDGERLLLVRHTYGPRGWDIPGGGSRRGEPPTATANREMAEELGLDISAWCDLGELRSVGGHHRIHLLGADVHAPALRPDPVELAETAWFHREALPTPAAPLLAQVLRSTGPAAFVHDRDRPPG